jgi:hypothetical protein
MQNHFASGVVLAGLSLFAVTGTANAAPLALLNAAPEAQQSIVEKAGYRNYCTRSRIECANRWGWRTWRFRRCLSIRGCL